MSWKMKQIVIKNFKFFHQSFTLDVNSRNLLIYGENGSGKSSVFWALYTLFQSRLKPSDADVEKYFKAGNDENLRNKYSAPLDESKVEVTFEDNNDPPDPDKTYIISLGNITTRQEPDTFLDFTVASSDFLNYKMLSKLTDKDNSVINDVTDLVVKEIYPFADFQTDYEDLDGNRSNIRNAKQWHDYILDSVNHIEHQTGRRRNHFDKNGPKYKKFEKLIKDFRDQLAFYLADLSLRATKKLKNEFNIKDVEVRFETDSKYDFDLPTSPKSKYRDHTLHPLRIRLNAVLKNNKLVGGNADILHLQTFFNEAKLTCIGLAIRLSVADMKYLAGGNLASILCMDDMLVSLDMSYREPVTKALFRYANNYQLCVFTHDRSLYYMMQSVIKELGYSKDDWMQLEFYRPDPETEATEEPVVNCIEPKEGKEKIKLYIARGDYQAAGNCLRQYAESLIKGILPLNLTYDIDSKGEITRLMLRGLYEKTVSRSKEGFCALYEITPTMMPNISKHLNRLMNPLSHDNKDVPIYRQELEDALVEVVKYEPILNAKKIFVKRDEAGKRQFKMEMANAGVVTSVVFVTVEQWDCFDFPSPTGRKYKNCEVQIKSCVGCDFTINRKMRVKTLYKEMKKIAYPTGAASAPLFDYAITDIMTGKMLFEL